MYKPEFIVPLLQAGANPNSQNTYGNTLLMRIIKKISNAESEEELKTYIDLVYLVMSYNSDPDLSNGSKKISAFKHCSELAEKTQEDSHLKQIFIMLTKLMHNKNLFLKSDHKAKTLLTGLMHNSPIS